MAKVIDITEKLSFEEKPIIKIGKSEIKVNNDAATILKVWDIFSKDKEMGASEMNEIFELMFDESERNKIKKLNLNIDDFKIVLYTAFGMVTGDSGQGEQ